MSRSFLIGLSRVLFLACLTSVAAAGQQVVTSSPDPDPQNVDATTSDDTSPFDFVTLRDGSVIRGEVVTLAAGTLLIEDAEAELSLQLPKSAVAAFEPAGSTIPATLETPESLELGKDVVLFRDGRIRAGDVTQIDKRRIFSEAGAFDRSEVWRVIFASAPQPTEPLWRQAAERDTETDETLDLLVNPDQWLELLEDPDLPDDVRREIEELLKEQEASRDAFEQLGEPAALPMGDSNGWCWTGSLQTKSVQGEGTLFWDGRLNLTLEELEFPGAVLGLRSVQLAARRGSYVAKLRETGECTGRFRDAGPLTRQMFLGGIPMLGSIQTISEQYAKVLEEETGQRIPPYENLYVLETASILVEYEYRLVCKDGHVQIETGSYPASYGPAAADIGDDEVLLLEENGTRMRGAATPDWPGEAAEISWDLRRIRCPVEEPPADFIGPEDDNCDQDWASIGGGYECTLARLRGELAEVWEQAKRHKREAERLRPAFDRTTLACGVFDIATTLLTSFLGGAKELEGLLEAREVIEGIVSGDLSFLLSKTPWKLFQQALSVHGAFTADVAAMRNRIESCRGKVSSGDYFDAVHFVDSLASFADAAARTSQKVMEYQQYELQRWEELTKARKRCLECAAEGHVDPADCPEVPPLR